MHMENNSLKMLMIILLTIFLSACSSLENPKIQKKLDNINVSDNASLKEKIHDILTNSKTLDLNQKNEIEMVFLERLEQSKHLLEQSYKLRALLVSELFTIPLDKKFIDALKNEIERTEQLRIKNTFSTIDKIYGILGHTTDDEDLVKEILSIGPIR